MSDLLVIGVGNEFRSDDGAGIVLARALASGAPVGVEVLGHDGEPVGLLQAWAGRDHVVVVDAVASDDPPGTIHRLDVEPDGVTAVVAHAHPGSSHALGVGEAVELARALDRMPGRLRLLGITGGSFASGVGLTPPVAVAVERLVDELAGAGVSDGCA